MKPSAFLVAKMSRWFWGPVAVLLSLWILPAAVWILKSSDWEYSIPQSLPKLLFQSVPSGISQLKQPLTRGEEPVFSALVPNLTRRRRYAINPLGYKWDHVNLTYKIVQFPSTLNKGDTERAIASAFRMWSDVSPLSFQRLPATQPADITIEALIISDYPEEPTCRAIGIFYRLGGGFYTFNHTDCWFSPMHPCFDGLNGELAHAFLPPRGEIHFDNHEFWILGRSRFSWKQGVWLNDLVQVAAHEIGHALGLWHSRDIRALMHPNATYSRTWRIGQDDVWAIQRLYGCVDEKRQCQSWAQRGLCTRQRTFMKRHCPRICNACFEHSTVAAASSLPPSWPSLIHTRYVSKGRAITFRCGFNSSNRPPLQVSWYKDGQPLTHSVQGLELLPNQELRVIVTEFSEGRYGCLIRRGSRTLRVNSWQIKLKNESLLPPTLGPPKDTQRRAVN